LALATWIAPADVTTEDALRLFAETCAKALEARLVSISITAPDEAIRTFTWPAARARATQPEVRSEPFSTGRRGGHIEAYGANSSADTRELLSAAAARVVLELDQDERAQRREHEGRTAERLALARVLHDGILQELTVAGFAIEGITKRPAERIRGELGAVGNDLRVAQARLRAVVTDLSEVSPTIPSDSRPPASQ